MKHKGRIGFVRHGETYANIDRVWHGHTDTELTPSGLQQAKKLGDHFHHYMKPDVIYSSPLQRARLTAESIAKGFNLDVNLEPRLTEFSLGDWEGRTFESLNGESDILSKLVHEPDFTAPGGESQNMVKRRIVSAIEEIVHRHEDQDILFVAHGITIAIALAHYVESDSRRWTQYTKNNTAFSELCLNTNALISFNQTAHLASTPTPEE